MDHDTAPSKSASGGATAPKVGVGSASGARADTHQHHDWFATLSRSVQEDWEALHAAAVADPQKAGHGGEATWVRLLRSWLPGAYGIGTRKYILPETQDVEPFETDIVVFNPGYPDALRSRAEVLAGGVAAAFSADSQTAN